MKRLFLSPAFLLTAGLLARCGKAPDAAAPSTVSPRATSAPVSAPAVLPIVPSKTFAFSPIRLAFATRGDEMMSMTSGAVFTLPTDLPPRGEVRDAYFQSNKLDAFVYSSEPDWSWAMIGLAKPEGCLVDAEAWDILPPSEVVHVLEAADAAGKSRDTVQAAPGQSRVLAFRTRYNVWGLVRITNENRPERAGTRARVESKIVIEQ